MAHLLRSLRLLRRSLQPTLLHHHRRGASTFSGGNSTAWLLTGGAATVVTIAVVYQTTRPDPNSKIGVSAIRQMKKKAYEEAASAHPEAVAEQQLAEDIPSEQKQQPAPPQATSSDDHTSSTTSDTSTTSSSSTASPKEGTDAAGEQPPPLALPEHVPYVLIGAGTASFAAAKAIREKDPSAKVLIIGDEEYTPYSRPPLSKQLWLYEDHQEAKQLKFKASWSGGKLVDVFYKAKFCEPSELPLKEEGGLAVLTGRKATALNTSEKKVTLDNGHQLSYDKCLIATGGSPRQLPIFSSAEEAIKKRTSLYRKIPDYKELDDLVGKVGSILIVGGGFLGSELAVGLASRGRDKGLKVTQLFPEDGNLGLVLPKDLTKWTTEKVKKESVEVLPNSTISSVSFDEGKVKVTTQSGKEVAADHVVVAVGLAPNTELAGSAHLETDPLLGGFRVNAELQAARDVWVAGDVACFYDPHLGRRRVEHHDHANVSGRLVGLNMAGGHEQFTHQSMFWSDVGPEVGFEATGLIDAKLPTVGIWAKNTSEEGVPVDDFSRGVVFYLNKEDRIVGVLTWNIFGKMDHARQIIAKEKTQEDISDLVAEFKLHSSE